MLDQIVGVEQETLLVNLFLVELARRLMDVLKKQCLLIPAVLHDEVCQVDKSVNSFLGVG